MFEAYRTKSLIIKLAVQEELVECLNKAEKEYGIAYYTNKAIVARCTLTKLKTKLALLQEE